MKSTGNHVADGVFDLNDKNPDPIEPCEEAKKAYAMIQKNLAVHYDNNTAGKFITHANINYNENGDIVINAPYLNSFFAEKLLAICDLFIVSMSIHPKNKQLEITLSHFE